MKEPRKGTYVWASWLSKVMAGEITCEWQSWFKAHWSGYTKAPSDFDQPKWMQEHTELLRTIAAELRGQGFTVSVESQNKFHYKTKDGVLIGCNPDLIAIRDDKAVIWDAKTGQQRASDSIQVMLYQLMAPFACDVLNGFGGSVAGMIFYGKTGDRVPTPNVDAAFIERVRSFCEIFSQDEPEKSPGSDCAFCDIAASECSARIEASSKRRQHHRGGLL